MTIKIFCAVSFDKKLAVDKMGLIVKFEAIMRPIAGELYFVEYPYF